MCLSVGHTKTSQIMEFEHTLPLSPTGPKLFSEGTLLFATVVTQTQLFKDVISCQGRLDSLLHLKWELAQASGSHRV